MGFATGQPWVWPCTPDWGQPVQESLAWLTDDMQSPGTGMRQVRQLRSAPRRGFRFQALLHDDERRLVDAFRREVGVQPFQLPIYPDVTWLAADLDAGVTSIPCNTAGRDFVDGGRAVLWRDANTWELVTIDTVAVASLTLTTATVDAWQPGDRVYPVRRARLVQPPRETQHSDDVSTLSVQVLIDEPCDWTAAWPSATTYRNLPVLDWRGDEAKDVTDQYDRLSRQVDVATGLVYYDDPPAMPFRAQSQQFLLDGRADHTKFRALAYQLAGRAGQCWVPDWQASARLATAATPAATQLTVAWHGYTQFDAMQTNRRDLRIELFDGTVFYRRVTGSAESGDNEVLQIDSALGQAVAIGDVRQINWMSVCASASDTVQLEHTTDADGIGRATIHWEAQANDV